MGVPSLSATKAVVVGEVDGKPADFRIVRLLFANTERPRRAGSSSVRVVLRNAEVERLSMTASAG
jgi:hypothetical protein